MLDKNKAGIFCSQLSENNCEWKIKQKYNELFSNLVTNTSYEIFKTCSKLDQV
jgi:hypothetical protein